MELGGIIKSLGWLGLTFLYAYFVGGKIPYLVFYTSLGVVAIALLWSRVGIRVSAHCYMETATAQVGTKVRVFVEIKNNSGWPVPWAQYWVQMPGTFGVPDNLSCYTFSLAAHEKKVIFEDLECTVRGCFPWGRGLLKTGDLFAVFNTSRPAGESKQMMVLPQVHDLGQDLGKFMTHKVGDTPVSIHAGRGGTNFIGVRKYNASDGMSRIHWKASARSQSLLVKEFQVQRMMEFAIYLDLGEGNHAGIMPDNSLERGITLAASIAGSGTKAGYGIGLVVFGTERIAIPTGYGKGHFNLLLESLVRARAGSNIHFGEVLGQEISFLNKNSHALVITGNLDEQLVDSLFWLKTRGQGSTVFLLMVETFAEVNIDLAAREQNVQRLKDHGIPVVMLEQRSDLRLIFRRLEYGVC